MNIERLTKGKAAVARAVLGACVVMLAGLGACGGGGGGSEESTDVPQDTTVLKAEPGGPYSSIAGRSVTFNGLRSTTPDPPIVDYAWDFGDGSAIVNHPTPSHVYPAIYAYNTTKTYRVTLTITDSAGNRTSAATSCRVTYIYKL